MNHGIWLRCQGEAGVDRLVEWGVAAEAAGWDGVFVSDSLPFAAYPDPWAVLAGIASRTDAITLGTWVVPVPRYHPWELANAVATVDRLADGRLILGAGLGNEVEHAPYGQSAAPPALASRLEESLAIVDELWQGEAVDFDGDHYTLTEATVAPTPAQEPRVPICTGCWWPNEAPFRRGARWDGIMPYFPSLSGEETGPHGEAPSGSPLAEVRAALDFYHDVADDPGEVVLPSIPGEAPEDYLPTYEELGATWTLTIDPDDREAEVTARIESGPPA